MNLSELQISAQWTFVMQELLPLIQLFPLLSTFPLYGDIHYSLQAHNLCGTEVKILVFNQCHKENVITSNMWGGGGETELEKLGTEKNRVNFGYDLFNTFKLITFSFVY